MLNRLCSLTWSALALIVHIGAPRCIIEWDSWDRKAQNAALLMLYWFPLGNELLFAHPVSNHLRISPIRQGLYLQMGLWCPVWTRLWHVHVVCCKSWFVFWDLLTNFCECKQRYSTVRHRSVLRGFIKLGKKSHRFSCAKISRLMFHLGFLR